MCPEVWFREFLQLKITRYRGEGAPVKKRRLVGRDGQDTSVIATSVLLGGDGFNFWQKGPQTESVPGKDRNVLPV